MGSPPDPGELLGRRDLVVVGAGPVGLAALWFAGRHGINAIAIESASSPLESIRRFSPGLVTASNALKWEIDGLPVDCRSVTEVTREDLLSYYSRVSSLGGLRVEVDPEFRTRS
jgi:NADPH-dependent 2,4-dienoyl-CoA reductase/sulfur reductase-like enzyme